uniref:Protein kinase domain-containing protein n=1 Tax=Parascaris univalens TaxID=6257 RepID=A0A914ZLB4_PARUN
PMHRSPHTRFCWLMFATEAHRTAPLPFCLLEKFFREKSCVFMAHLLVTCCFTIIGVKTASADILICYAESIINVNKRSCSTLYGYDSSFFTPIE